jgi:glycosyltransferase involved in cell wall biosynthesis
MNPLVSVIIPNYNYAQYVGEAVESALAQTYSNIEVIVVDDGSTDDSINVLEGFEDKINLVKQENGGVSAARNAGVAASQGELLAFLDADDIWHRQKVERQVAAFLGDNSVGLVHVGVQDIDETRAEVERHLDGMEGWVADELLKWERPVILGGGSGVMITRRAFDKAGAFDTRLMTSADWDLYYRVCRLNIVAFIPEILLYYRVHGSNMHSNVGRMEREMSLFYEKAFDTEDQSVLKMKDRALGNYHRVMAGSYFYAGAYGKFASHAAKSIGHHPSNIGYFLSYPLRRLK